MANLYGNPKNVKKYTGKHILTFSLTLPLKQVGHISVLIERSQIFNRIYVFVV